MEPPTIKATFNVSPEKLALFLNQVWAYVDRYGSAYFDVVACVNAIMVNLEGEWNLEVNLEGSGMGEESPL